MQARAVAWCTTVAGTRAHRSLEGAKPLALFEAVEAPALLALPPAPFQLARWPAPRVAPDCHVNLDRVLYSVPWVHIGKRVDARVTDILVEIFCDGQLIKTWPRAGRGRHTDPADYPPEKIAFFMRTPVWCRSRAEALGEHVTELVVGCWPITLHHLRAAQGIIGLGERYGAERLDAACRRALEVGIRPTHGRASWRSAPTTGRGRPHRAASASTPAHLHGPQSLFAHLNGDGAGGDGAGGDGDGVGGDGDGVGGDGDGVGGDEAVGA